MAVVDVQRWDRNMRFGNVRRSIHLDDGEGDFGIKNMANLISRPLRTGKYKFRHGDQPSQPTGNGDDLVRIVDEAGNKNCASGKPCLCDVTSAKDIWTTK